MKKEINAIKVEVLRIRECIIFLCMIAMGLFAGIIDLSSSVPSSFKIFIYVMCIISILALCRLFAVAEHQLGRLMKEAEP